LFTRFDTIRYVGRIKKGPSAPALGRTTSPGGGAYRVGPVDDLTQLLRACALPRKLRR